VGIVEGGLLQDLENATRSVHVLASLCGDANCVLSALLFLVSGKLFYTYMFFIPLVASVFISASPLYHHLTFTFREKLVLLAIGAGTVVHGSISTQSCTPERNLTYVRIARLYLYYFPRDLLRNNPIYFSIISVLAALLSAWLVKLATGKIDVGLTAKCIAMSGVRVAMLLVPYMLVMAGLFRLLYRTFC
jgi:hypothetical protein